MAGNLTFAKLAATIEMLKPEVQYIADGHCPKLDENGDPVFFYLSALGAFVLHPDNLNLMGRYCKLVKYEFTGAEIWPVTT